MKVGLFIPCYVDQFYPQVAIATLQLLERLGCEVHYSIHQTCCGQPMANAVVCKDLVSTMHEAYKRIDMNEEGYRIFIVGPSKRRILNNHLW